MFLNNIQTIYIILVVIFTIFIVIKQENMQILKPNEDKKFKKIDKKTMIVFILLFIIFFFAEVQNRTTKKETIALQEKSETLNIKDNYDQK